MASVAIAETTVSGISLLGFHGLVRLPRRFVGCSRILHCLLDESDLWALLLFDNVLDAPCRAIFVDSGRAMFVALLRFARRSEGASEHVTRRKVSM